MLCVDRISKSFAVQEKRSRRMATVKVLDSVSFTIEPGTCFGLIGESGSGKSTIARCILGLETIDEGSITFEGKDLSRLSARASHSLRREIQTVFQDPYASLNPRMRIRDIVAEPLWLHEPSKTKTQRTDRVLDLMQIVGLGEEHLNRFPHEFSGGQRQRIGIARALALNPRFLILDEPTSALDVSVQAQILNLLLVLQKQFEMTYLFISHDLGVIRYMCDRVAFLKSGQLLEEGATDQVFLSPQSTYAQHLLNAIPQVDPRRSRIRIAK